MGLLMWIKSSFDKIQVVVGTAGNGRLEDVSSGPKPEGPEKSSGGPWIDLYPTRPPRGPKGLQQDIRDLEHLHVLSNPISRNRTLRIEKYLLKPIPGLIASVSRMRIRVCLRDLGIIGRKHVDARS
jgi:hypothetical protein